MKFRKLLLLIAFAAGTTAMSAQTGVGESSLLLQGGLKTNDTRFAVGAQYRYVFLDNFRVAPDAMFMFPKDKVTGLDFNVNLHYTFELDYQLTAYPLAGLNMSNNRYAGRTINGIRFDSRGYTDWGFNLGGGVSYSLFGGNSYLNAEAKYIFSDADAFALTVGYGFKF